MRAKQTVRQAVCVRPPHPAFPLPSRLSTRYAPGVHAPLLQEPAIRFMTDHMLIRLGTYLRILGYDAAWDTHLRTHELILIANREQRIFITRNTRLPHQYPQPDQPVFLSETDPVQQLATLSRRLGLDVKSHLFSRCIRCNKLLSAIGDNEGIRSRVHPNVFSRHKEFFTCPACGTVFWHGSHVLNSLTKLAPVFAAMPEMPG